MKSSLRSIVGFFATIAAFPIQQSLAQTVLFTADFETAEGYTLGNLNAQNGWVVAQGSASVTDASAFSPTQSVLLGSASPASKIRRAFTQFSTESVVFVDFYAKPTAHTDAAQSTLFDTEALRTAFVTNGTNGEVYAFNGDGIGGGAWVTTGKTLPIDGNSQAQSWTRFTFRHDYTAKKSDVYVNGAMVKAGVRFKDDTKTAFALFELQAPTSAVAALDYFYVSSANPLFVDADKDGIEDAWETKYFGTTSYGAYDDPGAVGRMLGQSFQQALSPWPAPAVSSGLQAWFRADRGLTKDGSNKVSAWTDMSGNGAHAVQSTSSGQPLAVTWSLAARPAVRFDGSANILRSAAVDLFKSSNDITVFVVSSPGSSQQSYADILDYDHTTAPYGGFVIQQNGGSLNQYSMWWWYNGGWQASSPTTSLSAGVTQILSVVKGGTTQAYYVNGAATTSGTVPATMHSNPPRLLNIGGSSIGRFFNGDIAEILVYNRALSSTERAQVETALNARYFDDDDSLPGAWELQYLGTLDYGPNDDPGGVGRTLSQSHAQGLSPWPAASVTSGLQLWYRADLGVTRDGASKISRWADLSGNGGHVEQEGDSARPLAVSAALGTKPVARFDGADRMRSRVSVDVTKGNNDITVFAVVKPGTSQATYADIIDYDHTTAPYGGFVLQQNGGALNQYGLGWWNGGWQGLTPTATLAASTGQLIGIVKAGTTQIGYVNGEQKFSATVPSEMQANTPRFVGLGGVGAVSGDRYFNGDVAEILVYNRALTTAERQQLESELIAKYVLYPPPSIPADLTASALSSSQVSVAWGVSSGTVNGYTLERQVTGGSFAVVGEFSTRRAFIDSAVSPGTTYGYRVRADNLAGSSAYSAVVGVTVPGSAGTSQISLDGLRLWLRADAGVVATAGAIATWRDQSGLGNTAAQSTSANQPQAITAANGQPLVKFTGASQFLALPDVMANASAGEVFFVLRAATLNVPAGLWRLSTYGSSSHTYYPADDGRIYDDFGSSTLRPNFISAANPIDRFQIYNVTSAANAWTARFNGNVVYDTASNSVGFHASPLLGSDGGSYFNGEIGEVLVFDRALTATERQRVGEYLAQRHGVLELSAPATPTNLVVTPVSATQVNLAWTASTAGVLTTFVVERQTGTGAFVTLAELTNVTTYSDTTVVAGTQYHYRVTARTYGGVSGASTATAYPPIIDADGDGVTDGIETANNTNPVDYYNGRAFTTSSLTSGTVSYAYDTSGRLSTATYASATRQSFTFDAASNLSSTATTTLSSPPIEAWRQSHGLPADGSGNGGDQVVLAGDALPNLAKYAFGLVPQTAVTTDQPGVSLLAVSGANHLALTYRRPEPAPADLIYTVEVSTDGVLWLSGPAVTVAVSTTVNGSTADVKVRDASPVASPTFGRRIRLKIQRTAQP